MGSLRNDLPMEDVAWLILHAQKGKAPRWKLLRICQNAKSKVPIANVTASPPAMLLEKNPFDMFRQAVNIRIHGSGVDSEIMKPTFAFWETLALHMNFE